MLSLTWEAQSVFLSEPKSPSTADRDNVSVDSHGATTSFWTSDTQMVLQAAAGAAAWLVGSRNTHWSPGQEHCQLCREPHHQQHADQSCSLSTLEHHCWAGSCCWSQQLAPWCKHPGQRTNVHLPLGPRLWQHSAAERKCIPMGSVLSCHLFFVCTGWQQWEEGPGCPLLQWMLWGKMVRCHPVARKAAEWHGQTSCEQGLEDQRKLNNGWVHGWQLLTWRQRRHPAAKKKKAPPADS